MTGMPQGAASGVHLGHKESGALQAEPQAGRALASRGRQVHHARLQRGLRGQARRQRARRAVRVGACTNRGPRLCLSDCLCAWLPEKVGLQAGVRSSYAGDGRTGRGGSATFPAMAVQLHLRTGVHA